VSCQPGYYVTDSQSCEPCSETCLDCEDSKSCTNCNTELYYLLNGKCETKIRNLQVTNITLPNTCITMNQNFTVCYTFNNDTNQTMDFFMIYQGTHWFGLGFGTRMSGADMIISEIINNAIVVTSRYSPDHYLPPLKTALGGTNNVFLIDYILNSTTMVVHVNRQQNTSSPYDYDFQGPGNYSMIWAYNPNDTITDHHLGGNRGVVPVLLVGSLNQGSNESAISNFPNTNSSGISNANSSSISNTTTSNETSNHSSPSSEAQPLRCYNMLIIFLVIFLSYFKI